MVQYSDATFYYSRIGDCHLRYPGKLRRSAATPPWMNLFEYPATRPKSSSRPRPDHPYDTYLPMLSSGFNCYANNAHLGFTMSSLNFK